MANEVSTAPTTAVAIMAEKPLQYLDKAVTAIRDLGIWPEQQGEAADYQPSAARLPSWTRPASC